jgi:predicted O-methyltransferase YrrM
MYPREVPEFVVSFPFMRRGDRNRGVRTMTVRRIGTRKDALRRFADACVAAALPGGAALFPILAQVDGYLFPHEAVFLFRLARSGPGDGAIVEIGSYRGRSTLCLAVGVKGHRATRIAAVDPHVYGTEDHLRENLAHFGVSTIVQPIVAPSVAAAGAWTGPVRAVFVDGHHEQASVEADVDAWLPFLAPGGFLVLHDSTDLSSFPGPALVARTRLRVGPLFDAVGTLGGMTWARRAGGAHPWAPRSHGARGLDAAIRLAKAWGRRRGGA